MVTDDLDLTLVRQVAQGDSQALERLYERHGLPLLNYIIGQVGDRALAEELLQNVMLSVWKAAPGFRGESMVRTWLFAIARNHSINAHRKRKLVNVPLFEADGVSKTGPMEAMLRNTEKEAVRAALRQLSEEHRETLELIFYHGMSGPEAAEVLGVSVGTIKSRLHRAKALLKQVLTKEDSYE